MSAIGDIKSSMAGFQGECGFVVTVLSQNSKASPLMSRCSAVVSPGLKAQGLYDVLLIPFIV